MPEPSTPSPHESLIEAVRVGLCDYFRCRDEGCRRMGSMCPTDAAIGRALAALATTFEAIAQLMQHECLDLCRYEDPRALIHEIDRASIVATVLSLPRGK